MTVVSIRLDAMELRLAAVERVVFGDDPQREAELGWDDASQPRRVSAERVAGSQYQAHTDAAVSEAQTPEPAAPSPARGQVGVSEVADAIELVDDPPAWLAREAVGSIVPDTPAGRLAAEAAGILASVLEKHLHPVSLVLHAVLDERQLQADVQQAEPEPRRQAELERQAELGSHYQAYPEIDGPQLEAGD
jgi:hypothetical protein